MFKRFFSYIPLTSQMLWYSIRSQWEYKTSFFAQVFGMVLNDFLLICIWIFFFRRFQEVNSWTLQDTQLLISMHILAFSFMMFAFGGVLTITKEIAEGSLDLYLARPRSVLWQSLVGKNKLDVLGDLIFGLIMLTYVCITQGWINLPYVLFASAVAALSFLMVAIIAQSVGFWLKRFEKASVHYFWTVETPAFYPQNVFTGGFRVMLLTVVPSIWIITIPFDFIHDHTLMPFIAMIAFAVVITFVATRIFKAGLKKYESGNLVRVNN